MLNKRAFSKNLTCRKKSTLFLTQAIAAFSAAAAEQYRLAMMNRSDDLSGKD
jgi:hypothetical protein